jgi:glycerol-3-phosphate dehydrogenase (NAD(P)+)
MKIGYLGAGCWGYCLASVLASKGHQLVCWTTKADLAQILNDTREHPFLPGHKSKGDMTFTTDLAAVLKDCDLIVESVTSAGLRPVLEKVKVIGIPRCPLVITSKGIEQKSGLILPDVAIEVLGKEFRKQVGMLSGPGYAEEVIRGLPTSVVASAYDKKVMKLICDAFTTDTFRVYPNPDIHGVAFGGALKNIIAIACGIAGGLKLGCSAQAALITRGLHEIRKLAVACGCQAETLNGLSGMGDLSMTCSSPISRNYRLGLLLAEGIHPDEAQKRIKQVVEGVYTCRSAYELAKQHHITMPITEAIYRILYKNMNPREAAGSLMKRPIKEEHH